MKKIITLTLILGLFNNTFSQPKPAPHAPCYNFNIKFCDYNESKALGWEISGEGYSGKHVLGTTFSVSYNVTKGNDYWVKLCMGNRIPIHLLAYKITNALTKELIFDSKAATKDAFIYKCLRSSRLTIEITMPKMDSPDKAACVGFLTLSRPSNYKGNYVRK